MDSEERKFEGNYKALQLVKAVEAGIALVCLDARQPAVWVPAPMRANADLWLGFTKLAAFNQRIEINGFGVHGTLDLPGLGPTRVSVPWEAIHGLIQAPSDFRGGPVGREWPAFGFERPSEPVRT